MALVAVDRLLPERIAADPRLIERARGPGRVRGTAIELITAVQASPLQADPIVRIGLRDARYLHSAERRLVADGIYAWMKHGAWLAAIGGEGPEAAWDAWIGWIADGVGVVPVPDDDVAALALFGNVSPALARHLIADLADPVGYLAASNRRAPLVLRANRLKAHPVAVQARLAREGAAAEPSKVAPDGLVVAKALDLRGLGALRDGWCEVQDEGSQLVVPFAEPSGGFIDVCAGAGGKALHAAALGASPVVAMDVRRSALDELEKRARRAGAAVRTVLLDASGELPRGRPLERVLVDAPCSGTGTLRRHPELRLRLDEAAIAAYPPVQRGLLDRAAVLVAPGGWLVYATCSVLEVENEGVVDAFLADHPEFSRAKDDLHARPDVEGTDGMYAAALARSAG